MVIVYHGTNWQGAIRIANDGAILSPWEIQIIRLEKMRIDCPELYEWYLERSGSLEAAALKEAKFLYQEREVEHRVKAISVSGLSQADHYARQFEGFGGGAVLGIKANKKYLEKLPPSHSAKSHMWYVPRKLSLDKLVEVHLTTTAKAQHEIGIKEAFARYNPRYFELNS